LPGFVEEVPQCTRPRCLCVPSLAEPLGTSLLGGHGMGIPVLAVASGGVPETGDGNNGLLVRGLMRTALAGCCGC